MLRIFQLELDKPQSVLLVIGFSFQDKHIAKMVNRALKNNELMVIVFAYSEKALSDIKDNLGLKIIPSNLHLISPNNFSIEEKQLKELTLETLINILSTEVVYEPE